MLGPTREVFAALDLVFAGCYTGDCFGVGDVFFDQDSLGEGLGVVGVEDRDGALEDDGAVIELVVDEVDGAAGDFDAVVEGLLLGVEAGEGWEQGGVDVQDAVWKGCDEVGGEQAHVAGEDDQVDFILAETGEDVGFLLGAFAAFGFVEGGCEFEASGAGQAQGGGYV